jgi:hypothetical protein
VAHAIAVRPYQSEVSTEELRTAMIQFRAIFEELVQVQNPIKRKDRPHNAQFAERMASR